ncbi:hypothetical protein GYA37_02660 [candidate division WWE3 bacterium]|uniref:DUF304 domain-containing protein n=1 Tax=candidate division WWE3 bacterium TaxID=2053526 RepID=A0A7X9E7I0_UNCKA|nr:hypothetical protein [candidate division WWE3 bacterium]
MSTSTLLKSFIKNPPNTSYQGRDNDERIILVIRKSLVAVYKWVLMFILLLIIPIFLMPWLASLQYNNYFIFTAGFIRCLTAFWYLFSIGFTFQNFLNWYFEVLLVTNKKVVDIDNSCTNISEATLNNIQDVTSKISKGWEQILNIGSIYIQTAAEREEFEFDTIDNPSFVRDAIADLISKHKGHHGH